MSPYVLICGAPGVGTSTVAFPVMLGLLGAGHPTTYLDLTQLGLVGPEVEERDRIALRARNLAAAWSVHRSAGSQVLVGCASVGGPDEVVAAARAIEGVHARVVLLHASAATLEDRVLGRRLRESPRLPGPTLVGRSEAELRSLAASSARVSTALVRSAVADAVVTTDGLTADEVVTAVRAAIQL